jgi:hypothetical protein
VTEWGKTCLENGEYVPYEAGLFLSRIRSQIPNLDPIVDWYLMEALNSFRSGAYLAVAVMRGVAAERILIVWRDVIVASITEDNKKRKLIEATENQTAKRIYEPTRFVHLFPVYAKNSCALMAWLRANRI